MSTQPSKKRSYKRWIVAGAILVALAFAWFYPPLRAWLERSFAALGSADVDQVIELIRSYGPWAATISFLLMILQSLAAPIPAFLITLANAAIFGWWQGALLSWSSAMAGAALCFFIARALGRDTVVKLIGESSLKASEDFFAQYGKHTVLVARLLPFVSFDAVSYLAGLTSMGFSGFFIATGIGQLPATIVYSYVGGVLTGGVQYVVLGLSLLFAFAVIIFVAKEIYKKRNARSEDIYFPGCSVLELDSKITKETLTTLRKEIPGMELSTMCCGYPHKYGRGEKNYQKQAAKLKKNFERRGVKRVYSACPNCLKLLPELGSYEIIPIWDIMERNIDSAVGSDKTWALHDPCPTRLDNHSQDKVREILDKCGVSYVEFEQNRAQTRCCGQAHMIHRKDAEKSEGMRKRRAESAPLTEVVSYCQGCNNALGKENLETIHVFELIYGKSKKPAWYKRYITRYFRNPAARK